jgi:glycosyltransferase involved in cell wall biosynthesis
MKILINIPFLTLFGGVANHYSGLIPFWSEDVQYNAIGKRREIGGGKFWLPWDIVKFISKILIWKPDVILFNPSLGKSAIKRDTIFLKIAFAFHKKIIIFIHGWNKGYAEKLDKKNFASTFNKATSILVLAKEFKQQLIQWGITIPVNLTTTKVDDRMLEGFEINSRNGEIRTLLFLSRIEVEKGIFITINIFRTLKKLHPTLMLRIVGDGTALDDAKKYVFNNNIGDVVFTGKLSGHSLINEFKNADIYIFPTFFGEGMPTSVLEAMAFGLPVITRPIGGLADFFEDSKMGALIESLIPEDYLTVLEQFINSPKKCREISYYNHFYAKEHFLASKVAMSMEDYAKKVYKDAQNNIH